VKWPTVKLGEICDLQNGYAFKSGDYVEQSNVLNCRMSNIRPNGLFNIFYHPKYLPENFAQTYANFLLKDGDVIIAMTDLAGEPKILGVPTIVDTQGKNILLNQRVGKLVFKKNTDIKIEYLKYVLSRPEVKKYYKKFAGGGLQINLGKQDLLSISIPLPPLAEQQRIAAILDKAEEIRRKREQAIAKLDDLAHSTFVEMFGDGYTNKTWEYKRLGNCCTVKGGKRLPKSEDYSSKPTKHRYIRVTNIKKGIVDEANLLYLSDETFKRISRYIVNDGDVIISIAGSIGVTAPVTKSLDGANLTENAAKLTPIFKQILDNQYLSELLQTKKMQDQINANVGQVTISKLALFRIENLEIPVPPFELQLKFSNLLKEISKNKLQLIKSNIKTTELIQSLQHQAFTTGFRA